MSEETARPHIVRPGELSEEEDLKLTRDHEEEMEALREEIRQEERARLLQEVRESGGLSLHEASVGGEEFTALGDCPAGLRGTVWEEVWRSGIMEFRLGFRFRGNTPEVYVNFTRKEGKDFSDRGKIDIPLETILRRCAHKVRRIPPDTRIRKNHVPGADDEVDLGTVGRKAQKHGGWPQ
ncbi:MAG: hypothetical protein V3W22_04820 [Thermoplasmata archaeon]